MKRRRRVALIIETSNEYARGLLHGIRTYIREHDPWAIYLGEHSRGDAAPDWLKSWKGHGIIARIENARIARAIHRTGVPAVDLSAGRFAPDLPYVETDNTAIAQAAFDHLRERGFTNLAFVGDDRFQWSIERRDVFVRIAKEHGYTCDVFAGEGDSADGESNWEHEQRSLAQWLKALRKPVGLMACYDIRAHQVLESCRNIGIAVPEQAAVIGVDNDELLCDLADPSLTSVAPDTDQTGYRAAELLDLMMRGRKIEKIVNLIEPVGVIARRSTDFLATEDEEVIEAVRFIRNHACDGINVEDILEHLPMSRRVLEYRFRKALGRTPHEEIRRIQLDRAKELLTETELSMAAIAERAGFKHAEYLSSVFRKHMGMPPSAYRATTS